MCDYHQPLKILFLEDSDQDAELIIFALEAGGIRVIPSRVASKKDFVDALKNFEPDAVLADFSLPMFNGMHALGLFKELELLIPFILVTGALTESVAIEFLEEGVDDLVLKSRLNILPTILTRCLANKGIEREIKALYAELENKGGEIKRRQEQIAEPDLLHMLSERECQVFRLIAGAKTKKEIACLLNLSLPTVHLPGARAMSIS
jgi:DNA-binding NarL/FixJ family response regulator